MKSFLVLFLSAILISSTGCLKNDEACTSKPVESEQAQILKYASDSGINVTRHSSGLYYEIVNPGIGPTPNANSKIFIKYIGRLTNGAVFDQKDDHTQTGWILSSLIPGWQIGVPLIQKGGIIKLIIPSALAYGCQSVGTIPADAILYFQIDLVDMQ